MAYYDFEYLKEQAMRDQKLVDEVKNREAQMIAEAEDFAEQKRNLIEVARRKKEVFGEYCKFVKDTLLSEAIKSIYLPALSLDESSREFKLANNLVTEFIKENGGYSTIFLKNNANTLFIEALRMNIEAHAASIIEAADSEDPSSLVVDKTSIKDFLDDIVKEPDYENIKDAIKTRVSNAEEEFIANLMSDKEAMNQLIDDTNNKLDAIKSDENIDDATKEAITKDTTQESTKLIRDLYDKDIKTVFEAMVEKLSKSVIEKETLRESYTMESGKINIDKIVESVRCMYGFVETVNACKLEKINESYLEDLIKSM